MYIFDWIDDILFIYLLIEVVYLFFLGSVTQSIVFPCKPDKRYRYAVLIPKGFVFPSQNYPHEYYKIFEYTDWRTLIKKIDPSLFEEVVILSTFSYVPKNLLTVLNIANNSGFKTLQLHTVIHDNNTYLLRRKARKEELRNGLLKSGRCGLGLSSAMDKSNFVVPLSWTQNHLKSERTNLEWLMISHKIFIKYLSEPFIVSDKFPEHFNSRPFFKSLKRLYKYLPTRNMEEIERDVIHLFPSYTQLVIIIVLLSVILSFIQFTWSIKWWILLYSTFFAFSLAMPDYVMKPHKERKKYNLYRIWKNRRLKAELKKSE